MEDRTVKEQQKSDTVSSQSIGLSEVSERGSAKKGSRIAVRQDGRPRARVRMLGNGSVGNREKATEGQSPPLHLGDIDSKTRNVFVGNDLPRMESKHNCSRECKFFQLFAGDFPDISSFTLHYVSTSERVKFSWSISKA